ncbi:hypothetical protein MMIN_03840 [Mycolicibacter minnesotensis]|nr:hypothetical protein MMIN_03840 [Mycolicibacter minnesotensis]
MLATAATEDDGHAGAFVGIHTPEATGRLANLDEGEAKLDRPINRGLLTPVWCDVPAAGPPPR